MDIKNLYTKISEQRFRLRRVIANTVNHGPVIEQTKNMLYNNIAEIEEALEYAAKAEDQIKLLELELSDAERELDELAKKTTRKPKKEAEHVDG